MKKPIPIIVWIALGIAIGAAGAVVAFLVIPDPIALIKPATPEQDAVRAWLRENTDSGEWEEIRWEELSDEYGPITGLKYRTEGPAGGPILYEVLFRIKDGEAVFYRQISP